MNKRRSSLDIEPVVYEGEIIEPENKQVTALQENNKYAMSAQKIQTANKLIDAGTKVIEIFKIRSESEARVNEMEAAIKEFQAETERQVALLKEQSNKIVSKGEAVSSILSKLTPILTDQAVSSEEKKMIIELYEKQIDKVIKENAEN